jgi:hypothetical protein
MNSRVIVMLGLIAISGGCRPLPPGVQALTEIWIVRSPGPRAIGTSPAPADSLLTLSRNGISAVVDTWIALDSVSFRPRVVWPVAGQSSDSPPSAGTRRVAIVTSFQGSRYHPDLIRGLTESSDAVAVTAGSIASLMSASRAEGVILDFQEMAAEDIQTLVNVSRAIADSTRSRSAGPVAMIIPAADSSGYPARILARVADLLLVKLFPEHGATTPAGPIVSPDWFTRRLGQRASEAGVNRIVAGIPADGMIWDNRGARRISYNESFRLAREANIPIVRDPASGNLHAVSTRDGWELWVADHVLIDKLVAEGRRIGVTRFALFGIEGADPGVWDALPRLGTGAPRP